MEITIRSVKSEDISQLVDLMYRYIVDFYQRPAPKTGKLEEHALFIMNNPDRGTQFVAENEDGRLVGFATLYFTFSTLQVKKTAILNDLFVLEEARGHRVGERLFSSALRYVREHDYGYMAWETAKDNVVAQALYKKMGGELSEFLHYEIS